MLLSFRVANFRSIRDEQELSLRVPTAVRDAEELAPAREAGWDPGVSAVAGIYGANASGKTNVLDALWFMQSMFFGVWPSFTREPGDGVPVEPFRLDRRSAGEPSEFDVEVDIGGARYQYGFQVDSQRVLAEWLYAWPAGRRQTWFERDNPSGEERYYFGKAFAGQNHAITQLTRQNQLFLAVAFQRNHKLAGRVGLWFVAELRPILGPQDGYLWRAGPRYQDVRPEVTSEAMVGLLKLADLGISGINIVERHVERVGSGRRDDARSHTYYEIELTHAVEDEDPVALPFGRESAGTKAWFGLAEQVMQVLDTGGILLVDELDSSLHPHLAAKLVGLFQDPASNPRQAQIVFNAHDTSLFGTLLGEPVLRRDQIWLTEKDGQGATSLYPVSDFKPRKLENLERGYLQGRYGAVPAVGVPEADVVGPGPDR